MECNYLQMPIFKRRFGKTAIDVMAWMSYYMEQCD